jgi:EAL and modified HD-GYP domain-containing signal transduction protein
VPLRPLDAIPVVVRAEIVDERHRLCGYRFHAVARQHGTPLAENAMVAALQEARVLEFAPSG